MKIITLISLFLFSVMDICAQTETFDLIIYTAPPGWTKETKGNVIGYTKVDNGKNSWCQIAVYKSTVSKGSIKLDFESEWQELVVKRVKPTKLPEMEPVSSENGWDFQAGSALFEFNGNQSVAMLATISGFSRCTSITILTNTQDYQKEIEIFLQSVKAITPVSSVKAEVQAEITPLTNGNNNDGSSIIGSWQKSGSVPYRVGEEMNAGYTSSQYTFNTDGTYRFVSKIFRYSYNELLLVKENGTYQINGKSISLNPQKSVLESWSKKDGTDKWGKLLSSQDQALEKTTYQFTMHYFSGIEKWNLVLQASQVTQREGPFSNNTTFSNAWYYNPVSSNNPEIELPDGQ